MGASQRLFEPLKVGNVNLSSRLVMAPLTRYRADDNHIPTPMMTRYYEQRACVPGTLLITEGTFISPEASGYRNVPGIWSEEQIEAWKSVTKAVHEKGSYIFMQLWAMGRAAVPEVMEEKGLKLVSSSAVPMPDTEGAVTPIPLTEEDIWRFVSAYAQAAKNAIEAGFDGVELHGANGYLIDQFTQDTCNKREDAWGGSIENRSRFAVEATKAVVNAIGAERTAIRISPFSKFQGMFMEDRMAQFTDVVSKLKELKLAYLHIVESRISGNADTKQTEQIIPFVDLWANTSPVFAAGGFKADSARKTVNEEYADRNVAVVMGRYFISNPDLVFRIKEDIQLEDYDRKTFYKAKSEEGYTDYAFSKEFETARL